MDESRGEHTLDLVSEGLAVPVELWAASEHPRLRSCAARALTWATNRGEARILLHFLLGDPNPEVLCNALKSARHFPAGPDLLESLERLVDHADPAVSAELSVTLEYLLSCPGPEPTTDAIDLGDVLLQPVGSAGLIPVGAGDFVLDEASLPGEGRGVPGAALSLSDRLSALVQDPGRRVYLWLGAGLPLVVVLVVSLECGSMRSHRPAAPSISRDGHVAASARGGIKSGSDPRRVPTVALPSDRMDPAVLAAQLVPGARLEEPTETSTSTRPKGPPLTPSIAAGPAPASVTTSSSPAVLAPAGFPLHADYVHRVPERIGRELWILEDLEVLAAREPKGAPDVLHHRWPQTTSPVSSGPTATATPSLDYHIVFPAQESTPQTSPPLSSLASLPPVESTTGTVASTTTSPTAGEPPSILPGGEAGGAEAPVTSALSGFQSALLSLRVNMAEKGDILVLLKDKDVWVSLAAMKQAGFRDFSGEQKVIKGENRVRLASLAPDLSYALKEETITLEVTAQPRILEPTVLRLSILRPPKLEYVGIPSSFLNYSFAVNNFETLTGFGELGHQRGSNLALGTFSFNADGTYVRLLTEIFNDDRRRLRRITVGDTTASTEGLGGSLLMGGFTLSRQFALDPYFSRAPAVNIAGTVLTPSTADIYVNGQLVRRETLAPGNFKVNDMPVTAGNASTRVVLHDALGGSRELSNSFYYSASVLKRGLNDYSYSLGLQRNNFGINSADYGPLALLARHRFGVTDSLTLGLRLEALSDLRNIGASTAMVLPVGELSAELACSRDKDSEGTAAAVGYSYSGKPVSLNAGVRTSSRNYSAVGMSSQDDRQLLQKYVSVMFSIFKNISVNLQYAFNETRDQGVTERSSFQANRRLGKSTNLMVSGAHTDQTGRDSVNELYGAVTYSLDNRTTEEISHQQQGSVGTNTVSVNRSLPVGPGFGYRLGSSHSRDQTRLDADVKIRAPFGFYTATYNATNHLGAMNLNLTGSVVALGERLYPSSPVDQSYGLLRVRGVKGVRGYLNQQPMGRTDEKGDMFIPNLAPFYANRLSIEPQDIPLDYRLGSTARDVAPSFRGGAITSFDVQKVHAVSGKLRVLAADGKFTIPKYGQLTVTVGDKKFESPIGNDGEFYLENVPVGTYKALVEYKEGSCQVPLVVAPSKEMVVKLGVLTGKAAS